MRLQKRMREGTINWYFFLLGLIYQTQPFSVSHANPCQWFCQCLSFGCLLFINILELSTKQAYILHTVVNSCCVVEIVYNEQVINWKMKWERRLTEISFVIFRKSNQSPSKIFLTILKKEFGLRRHI